MDSENNVTVLDKPRTTAEIEAILNPIMQKWFYSRFNEFSLPQLYGVVPIHQRQNILISAPTGATKTLTGFMSILNELVDSAEKGALQDKVYCVYLSPLKALNNDIQKNLTEPLQQIEDILGKKLGIRVSVRTGDTTQSEKAAMLKHPPHILITTPESLAILLSSIKFKVHLSNVDWVIVDEIHALAENKRGVHLSLSLERLQRLSPAMCRVGLSATVAPLTEVASFLVGPGRPCQIVDVQFLKNLDLKVLSPVSNLIDTEHDAMHRTMYELIDALIQEHRTTLIFTNTRAATERVVDHLKHRFPKKYVGNIGAHHGSLSKELRFSIEDRLRKGELKCVVSSTSLELGLDIGYIDLVICLGSPKSVARFLQRAGRSGHKLHETVKARIIVMDRDDLVECAVLLKSAVEKKIDKLHIPTNCLDVLAQQIVGASLEQVWEEKDLFDMIRHSYCYQKLSREDFSSVLDYLSGKFAELEDRHIYSRIWREEGKLGRRGKMSRVIYMTNIGTIPDESFITVKIGEQTIGKLDEGFLERLKPGDVFVLGGDTYQFKFSRGMVAQVAASSNRPPTVPSWVSEMLPLSFDLASEIGRFRRLMLEQFTAAKPKGETLKFINSHLHVDDNAASAIYDYFREQYDYVRKIPTDRILLIEHFAEEKQRKVVFHSLYGRRVNDCLSRAVAYAIAKTEHRDVEIGINDNGFFIGSDKKVNVLAAFKLLKSNRLDQVLQAAIEGSEAFKRRFRHCAARALMILRNYKGQQKRVGRQQVSSMILMTALKRISNEFSVLKEARREVLEDLMDVENTKRVLADIEAGKIRIVELDTTIPSPFAFNIALQGYLDVLRIEDKIEFLRRMHQLVLAKIGLEQGKRSLEHERQGMGSGDLRLGAGSSAAADSPVDYHALWEKSEKDRAEARASQATELKRMAWNLDAPMFVKEEIVKMIDGDKDIREDVLEGLQQRKEEMLHEWPEELQKFVRRKLKELS